jgi:hypothetical protein
MVPSLRDLIGTLNATDTVISSIHAKKSHITVNTLINKHTQIMAHPR